MKGCRGGGDGRAGFGYCKLRDIGDRAVVGRIGDGEGLVIGGGDELAIDEGSFLQEGRVFKFWDIVCRERHL